MPVFSPGFGWVTPPKLGSGQQGFLQPQRAPTPAPVAAPAPPPPAPAPPPPPPEPQIPEPSLRGQTWGHVIPITAGLRTIPGRPVEIRVTKGADGHWVLDTLVSFGWRAEIMAGHAPVEFTFLKLTANGVVLYDATTGVTAPGVTLTWYNGEQVTADPFWAALNGAGQQPAYVYHILVNVVGLPLQNFNDGRPDAWAVTVKDGPTGAPITDNVAIFAGYNADNTRIYGGPNVGSWSAGTWPIYSLSGQTGYATGPLYGTNSVERPNPTGNFLGLYVPAIDRCIASSGSGSNLVFSVINPHTGAVTAISEETIGWSYPLLVRGSTICYGQTGGVSYLYVTVNANNLGDEALKVFRIGPSEITHVYTSGPAWDGNVAGAGPYYDNATNMARGPNGSVAVAFNDDAFFVGDIILVTAKYNGTAIDYTTTVWSDCPAPAGSFLLPVKNLLYRETTSTWLLAWRNGEQAGLYEFGGDLDVRGLANDIWYRGSGSGNGSDSPFHANSRCGDALIFSNGGGLGAGYYNSMDLETGVISTVHIPLAPGTADLYQASDVAAFNTVGGARRVGYMWTGTVLSTTGGVEGLTLARWFSLLGDLTRHLNGKVTVGANITDTLDSLFLVDTNTTFNRDGLAMCRVSNCDMRENNEGIEIVRGVQETTYVVNETLTDDVLLRAPGQAGITFTRVGEDELPSEVVLQFIASEASFRFTERPARRELGPMPTTTSTKRETIKIQAGMPINQGQTWVSKTLYREIEARDQFTYKLPWAYAIKVQAADIHIVPETQDSLGHVVKVTRADRESNRLVQIQAQRLHTNQNYVGVADVGTSYPPFVAVEDLELTLGGIVSTAQVFPPTITEPPLALTVGGIASGAAVFAPTFEVAASYASQTWALFDSNSLGAGGSAVSQWNDTGPLGANRHATQATSTKQPVVVASAINGLKAIRLVDATDGLIFPSMTALTRGATFLVLKGDFDGGTVQGFPVQPLVSGEAHYPYSDSIVYCGWMSNLRPTCGNPTQALNAWHILSIHSAPSDYRVYINNVLLYSSVTNTPTFTGFPYIGKSDIGASGWLGQIAEVVIFTHELTTTDRTAEYNRLKTKYGL